MTFRDIYAAALRMLAESESDGDTSYYEERACYLLAAFCSEHSDADNRYREQIGQGPKPAFTKLFVELDDAFPHSDIFLPIASYYLAAMLSLEENESLSDRYFAKYTDAITSIFKAGAEAKPIRDRYNLLH